jgi:hypothetical protein
MASDTNIHELASGDIAVWQEQSGVIVLKLQEKHGDPVELGEEEALELAELLIELVKNAQQ